MTQSFEEHVWIDGLAPHLTRAHTLQDSVCVCVCVRLCVSVRYSVEVCVFIDPEPVCPAPARPQDKRVWTSRTTW